MAVALRKPSTYIALLLLAVCLVGIYYAVRMGIGDLVAYRAEYASDRWAEAKRNPEPEELETALDEARSAIEWEPTNADHLDLLGQLLMQKGVLAWESGAFNAITDEALTAYRRASTLRPHWPYTWANLAALKAYRGEIDTEFATALNNAVKYGPWEPDVHVILAEAGLFAWSKLNVIHRRTVAETVHRGLTFKYKEMAEIAERYALTDSVCGYFPIDKKVIKFCNL